MTHFQGTTAGQWALLQTVGTLLGVCGTVFGYPFLKSRFEKKVDRHSGIQDELKALGDNTTSLYNEMVDVFTPYLHLASIGNKKPRDEQREAAEHFAFRRDHRARSRRLVPRSALPVTEWQEPFGHESRRPTTRHRRS